MKSVNFDQAMKQWEAVRSANSYPILVITDEVLEMIMCDGEYLYITYVFEQPWKSAYNSGSGSCLTLRFFK